MIKAQIGQGSFGKVFLAELPNQSKKYAIKVIRKDKLIQHEQITNTILEKDILVDADHPFLCGMEYLFQSEARLYFVLPFVGGGELYRIFKQKKILPENVVKFYATQIIVALGKLHERGIVHRDIKLENVMVDTNGYIKIIDFGLAKYLDHGESAMTFCGTAEYFAPEVITRTGHDRMVDWWAVGVLIFEMLFGTSPFFNPNRQVLMSKIKSARVVFPSRAHFNIEYSDTVVDLILKLLTKDKAQRLGATNDAAEILAHEWFADIDIPALESLQISAPFLPSELFPEG